MDWKLSVAGLLIGLLVGATGMGGGSLMTPMLVLLFGFQPTIAIGTDILHGAIFKSFGAAQHRRLGHVHARVTMWMLLGSAPASLGGVAFASYLARRYGDGFQDIAKDILGIALIVAAFGFMLKTFIHVQRPDLPFVLRPRDRVAAVIVGLVGGFIVGLTSVGSGTFFALAMLVLFPLTAAKIVGTDIYHAALLLWVAGMGQLAAGNVDLAATGWLLIGSIPGVLLGGHITVRLPDRGLRAALAVTLGLAGAKLVELPGANALIIAAMIAAGLLGLFAVLKRFTRRPRRAAVVERRRDAPEARPAPEAVEPAAGHDAG